MMKNRRYCYIGVAPTIEQRRQNPQMRISAERPPANAWLGCRSLNPLQGA